MLNLDLFEVINTKTPWVAKNSLNKLQEKITSIKELIQKKGLSLYPLFFESEKGAFIELLFSLAKEKTLGQGKNHILIADHLRATFRDVLNQFELFGFSYDTIPSDLDGRIDCKALMNCIYPTTLALIVETYDTITGVEQPIQQLISTINDKIHLHVIVPPKAGFMNLYPGIHSLQVGNILFKEESLEAKGCNDVDLIFAASLDLFENVRLVQQTAMQAAYLKRLLERNLESIGAHIFFKGGRAHPLVTVFGFEGLHGELLAYYLAKQNIMSSIGGGHRTPLHQHLIRMGIKDELAVTALHISLHNLADEKQVMELIETISQVRSTLLRI